MSAAYTKSEELAAVIRDLASENRAVGDSELLSPLLAKSQLSVLTGDRLLAVQALRLLIRVDRNLLEARAQWNQDWFRRLMHARPRVVARILRRWEILSPPPRVALGSLRRRYHANLSKYLYEAKR